MSDLKPMSAAKYRAHAQKVSADRPIEIVRLKSGSVFALRRPDLEAFMIMGRLPQSLVTIGIKAWKSSAAKVASEMTDQEAQDALIFMREIVHDCTVTPKFVEFATKDDEISASEMLKEDFDEIFEWAMGHVGVAGISGLQSFRPGSTRGTTGDRAHSKKRRRKSQQPVEAVGTLQ